MPSRPASRRRVPVASLRRPPSPPSPPPRPLPSSLQVVGATGSTIVTYVLPGACYLRLFPERPSRWLGLWLLACGCFICPVSLYLIFFPAPVPAA